MYNIIIIIMDNRYKRSIEKYGRPTYLQLNGEWFKGVIKQYNSKTFFEMIEKVLNPKALDGILNMKNLGKDFFGYKIPGTNGSMTEYVSEVITDAQIDEIV